MSILETIANEIGCQVITETVKRGAQKRYFPLKADEFLTNIDNLSNMSLEQAFEYFPLHSRDRIQFRWELANNPQGLSEVELSMKIYGIPVKEKGIRGIILNERGLGYQIFRMRSEDLIAFEGRRTEYYNYKYYFEKDPVMIMRLQYQLKEGQSTIEEDYKYARVYSQEKINIEITKDQYEVIKNKYPNLIKL